MSALHKAVEAAGNELQNKYSWGLDDNHRLPVLETLFARVLLSHLEPLFDPSAGKAIRKHRIEELEREIESLRKLDLS